MLRETSRVFRASQNEMFTLQYRELVKKKLKRVNKKNLISMFEIFLQEERLWDYRCDKS